MPSNKRSKDSTRSKRRADQVGSRRPSLPQWVCVYVWARAAGRCEFPGCNEPLWKDLYTTREFNRGKIAHIVAASADGPRGDSVLSPKLAADPANLLLLCPDHHELVDKREHVEKYPVETLRTYKRLHEERIERLTAISEDKKTVPVVLQFPIHEHADTVPRAQFADAISANGRYPDDQRWIDIDFLGMTSRDHDAHFWGEALTRMRGRYDTNIDARRGEGPIGHLSIFARGPIPLLIAFGRHIGDQVSADVYNWHRDPKGWRWPSDGRLEMQTKIPSAHETGSEVGLVLSITSEVVREHYLPHLPPNAPVFEVRSTEPFVDRLRHPADLASFVHQSREVMEAIHRRGAKRVHVFAALPVAAAVEFGRALMPKLHAPLALYDFHRAANGWRLAFEISGLNSTHTAATPNGK